MSPRDLARATPFTVRQWREAKSYFEDDQWTRVEQTIIDISAWGRGPERIAADIASAMERA